MESEHDRLDRLYRELGDEHLKDLADDAEDLTDEGRMALAREMRRRGFAPAPTQDAEPAATPSPEYESGFGPSIPGIFPGGSSEVEHALEPGGEQRLGWTALTAFYDGIDLSTACSALDDADVDVAIENIAGDALSGAPQRFNIWVRDQNAEQSRIILRARMGLFPEAEVDHEAEDVPGDEDSMMTLGDFNTQAEAQEVGTLLQSAGIHHVIADPETIDGEDWYSVQVPADDMERGLQVVAAGLRVSSTAR